MSFLYIRRSFWSFVKFGNMENRFGLYLVLLSVTCFCKVGSICSVPDDKKSYVTSLAVNMGRSVGPCVPPNPSVLLAMNLGKVKDPTSIDMLIKQLKKDAVDRVANHESFSSGNAALYVLALQSSCVDPSSISGSGGNIDLVNILEDKTKDELKDFENNQPNASVITNWYQIGLDVISLCVMSRPYAISAAHILASHISSTTHGSVDTAAVAVMGLACVLEMENVPEETRVKVNNTMIHLLEYILGQQNNGLIGNVYSTGLGGMALIAAKAYYSADAWDCPATINKVIDMIPNKTFSLPIAAAQVLPFLWGESYVSVKSLQCPPHDVQYISVEFIVVNNIVGKHFQHDITVDVREGSTLLQVMEKAAELDPAEFSFKSEESQWGVFIIGINQLDGSTNDKTFWQFLSDNKALDVDVMINTAPEEAPGDRCETCWSYSASSIIIPWTFRLISVEFTVVNDLIGNPFKNSISVEVREGSTLLQVMEKAAELKPKEFSFTFKDYTFGVYITSINQLQGSTNDKTYWQFFSGNIPLSDGVSDYIPRNKEHILAVYSKF